MADVTSGADPADEASAREAYGAARELLEAADEAARLRRAEADRYAAQREREADLLIEKARRLLLAAEAKASVIIATAHALPRLAVDDDLVIDLDSLAHVIAPGASVLRGSASTRLDGLLAAAIAHAVDDAFPLALDTEPAPA
jgi:hypothetical protein